MTTRNAGATVAIYGPQATGLSYGNIGYRLSDVRTQLVDNVSLVTGTHGKGGRDLDTVIGKTTFNPGANGITRSTAWQTTSRKAFQIKQFASSGSVDATISQVAFYVQDEWRLRSASRPAPVFATSRRSRPVTRRRPWPRTGFRSPPRFPTTRT